MKTASKVRFAEPGDEVPSDAPSPPLADPEDKDKDDKVNTRTIRTLKPALRYKPHSNRTLGTVRHRRWLTQSDLQADLKQLVFGMF